MPDQAINNTWTGGATPTPDEWELHTWNFIAAVDGAQTFYIQGSGQAWVDDVAITVVPEPMTMALLGLGGLFLRRKKR